MAVELASGYVSINPSTKGFGSDLNKQLGPEVDRASRDAGQRAGDSFTSSFGGGLGKLAAVAAGAFASIQVGSLIKDSVTAASDLGETVSKVGVILGKESLPGLETWAEAAATTFGQSKQQALDAAATFATFGKSAGLSGGDLAGFSTGLTELAGDLGSFFNDANPQDAIDAIGSALRGESEPIRRYGVLLDDATLKNRALELGLISTTKNALTPQQRVLAAQAEIYAQTTDAQGDFARTSGGLAGQLKILKGQLANGRAELGKAFLPAVTSVVTFLTSKGIPGFRKFTSEVKDKVAPAFAAARRGFNNFTAELDGIGKPADGFAAKLGDAVGRAVNYAKLIGPAFMAAFDGGGVTSDGLIGVIERVAGAVRPIIDTAKLIPGAFSTAFNSGDVTSDGFIGVVETIATKLASLVTFLQTDVPAAVKAFTDGFKNGSDDLDKNAKFETLATLGATFKSIVDTIKDNKDVFIPIATGLAAVAGALALASKASSGLTALSGAFSGLSGLLPLIANPLGIIVVGIVGLGVAAFLAYKKLEPFHEAVDGVLKAFKEGGFGAAVEKAGEAFGALWEFVKPHLIEFRDKAAAWVSDHAGEIFAGIGKAYAGVVKFLVSELLEPLGNWIVNTGLPWLREKAGEWATAFSGWVEEKAWPFLRDELPVIIDGIIAWARDNEPKILDAFNRFSDAAWKWIEEIAIPKLKEKLPGIIAELLAWANDNFSRWGAQIGLLVLDAVGRLTIILLEWVARMVVELPPHLVELGGRIIAALFDKVFGDGDAKLAEFAGKIVGFITGLPAQIVTAAVGMWHGITDAFDVMLGTVSADKIVGILTGLPERITTAASGMWNGIYDAFKGALNLIIDGWNGLEFKLPSFGGLTVGKVQVIPGFEGPTLGTPDIPKLAGGGVFTNDFTGLLRLAETPAARPEIVTPQRLMAETFRKELAAVGATGPGRQVDFGGVTINEAHDPNKTLAVLDGWARWKLTGRGDR